jgi:hypothetical protein
MCTQSLIRPFPALAALAADTRPPANPSQRLPQVAAAFRLPFRVAAKFTSRFSSHRTFISNGVREVRNLCSIFVFAPPSVRGAVQSGIFAALAH